MVSAAAPCSGGTACSRPDATTSSPPFSSMATGVLIQNQYPPGWVWWPMHVETTMAYANVTKTSPFHCEVLSRAGEYPNAEATTRKQSSASPSNTALRHKTGNARIHAALGSTSSRHSTVDPQTRTRCRGERARNRRLCLTTKAMECRPMDVADKSTSETRSRGPGTLSRQQGSLFGQYRLEQRY